MSRLIDADELFKEFERAAWYNNADRDEIAEEILLQMPTINPDDLRPRGRWILGHVEPGYFTPGGNRPWICSNCGYLTSWMLDKPKENFCPNCGAKMIGENDEAN